ncbi:CCR4-NOT transcription complex subunit 5, putative [Hepatocystis sp. ex Piliocolobus tephrosceles]|nr:CCR4-NOT transcription complex subunit 5, putative [Hepatocystis sp. ex Piliocolobus tephrosceles]
MSEQNKDNESMDTDNHMKTNSKNDVSLSAQKLLESNTSHLLELIACSYKNRIKTSDRDQFKQYIPRMLWGNPCTHFPTTPLSDFQSPELFERFDLDTLFFIFYYQSGTYQQHLASKELKKKSWKYHKKYTTWFLPYDNNIQVLNDKTEKGTYLSFDYESTWSKQLKENFTFEHIYLEDEVTV